MLDDDKKIFMTITLYFYIVVNFGGEYVHPHTHPYTQLKKSRIPHTQLMQGFPVKTETGSYNIHENEFICHFY